MRAPQNIRQKIRFALVASILLHLFIFFASPIRKNPKPARTTVAVEIISPPKIQDRVLPIWPSRTKSGGKSQSARTVSASPALDRALNPFAGRYLRYRGGDVPSGSDSGAKSGIDDPGVQWGSGAGDFQRVEELSLMDRIYAKTDGLLIYPSILAAHGVQGIVNSRLVLDSSGSCDWRKTTISSVEPHLRVYVLSVMKDVCHQNFSHYIGSRKLTNVDLSFDFEVTEHNEKELIESQKRVVGNVLLFYRNSQHSIAQWKLGPFSGLFPVPYVSVDFEWLQTNWDRIVDKKEPLSDYGDPAEGRPSS